MKHLFRYSFGILLLLIYLITINITEGTIIILELTSEELTVKSCLNKKKVAFILKLNIIICLYPRNIEK